MKSCDMCLWKDFCVVSKQRSIIVVVFLPTLPSFKDICVKMTRIIWSSSLKIQGLWLDEIRIMKIEGQPAGKIKLSNSTGSHRNLRRQLACICWNCCSYLVQKVYMMAFGGGAEAMASDWNLYLHQKNILNNNKVQPKTFCRPCSPGIFSVQKLCLLITRRVRNHQCHHFALLKAFLVGFWQMMVNGVEIDDLDDHTVIPIGVK